MQAILGLIPGQRNNTAGLTDSRVLGVLRHTKRVKGRSHFVR